MIHNALVGIHPKSGLIEVVARNSKDNWESICRDGLICIPTSLELARVSWGEKTDSLDKFWRPEQ